MRLFKSSNKSQASLDRLTGSRDHSPTQQPDPTYPHAQAYTGPPTTAYPPSQYQQPQQQQQQQQQHQQQQHQHQQQLPAQNSEGYYTEAQHPQHPATHLGRTQSSRATSGVGDPYVQDQQPTVNIVPPANVPVQQPHQNQYTSSPNQFGSQQPARPDKEHKKSKRSFIGLLSKREDRDEAGDRRSVGRASSILKKGGPQSPQAIQTSPKVPSSQYPNPRQAELDDRFSAETLPQDSAHYTPYHEPQDQYRPRDQFESPQSQHTRQSIQYLEDSRYQSQHPPLQGHPAQDRPYPIYQLPHSANSSDNNLPYQVSRTSASTYDTNQALRPPSQSSLGPPSPLVGQSLHDSRPSTSNTQQQRFSTQSQQQQSQQQQQLQQTQHHPQNQQQHTPLPSLPPQQQPQPPQIQQPQPQHHHPQQQQPNSLPSSQQPTPQPTPQPQASQQQQVPSHSHQPNTVSNMPRNEPTNGRRLDENIYAQQDPRIRAQSHEQSLQGRNTPPPSRAREDLSSLDYSQLLAKHEDLQAKYSKVKRYYFERDAQVTQLQNTVANQRLSMSKTSLDDAGYTTRFERLNGAIQNLSFNIRKDWRRIPNWLAPVCNRDAHTVGTKEMTAVGRACITRWLYEFIFERVFHPGIDPNLSSQLKSMERTLRRSQYGPLMTSEQQDDVLTKITTWRLTTVEGLQDVLNSRSSQIYTETLVMDLSKQIESYLRVFLTDPPPAGLSDSLGAIVGQAISISQNIPLESRDIRIEYFMPGCHIADAYMRLEPGMTVLSNPGSAPVASDTLPTGIDNEDQASITSSQLDPSINVEEAIRESAKAASAPGQGPSTQRNESISSTTTGAPKQSLSTSSKEKKGFLGGFVNKKATHTPPRQDHDQSKSNDNGPPEHAYTLQSLTGGTTDNKIRFAAFVAVEVRGRGVLKEAGKEGEKGTNSSKESEEKKDPAFTSGGPGAAAPGSATTGTQKSGGSGVGANILCKAPVYAFE